MKSSHHFLPLCLFGTLMSLFVGGCASVQTLNEVVKPSKILINEIQAGADGNNNFEFIELYNYGGELINLQGWSVVYRLPSSDEDLIVTDWDQPILIAPFGSFLLVRSGQDLGVIPDGYFDQALNTTGGGLGLLNPDGELVDAVAWGKAPTFLTEGTAAPELLDDHSLVRHKNETSGEVIDTDDNFADFVLNPNPQPQNVTFIVGPGQKHQLQLVVSSPVEVQPGDDFIYTIRVSSQSETSIDSLLVQISLPDSLENIRLSRDWEREGSIALWPIERLEPDQSITSLIEAQAPWIYGTLTMQNAYVRTGDAGEIAFAPALRTEVAGGVIPISIARTLINQDVIVEGIATMYTGGFFAGSSGTKFYLDDGSAGVQIYVPDGMGVVDVPIGARVRVEGEAQLYRGALEIVPDTPELVEVLDIDSGITPAPLQTTIRQVIYDLESTPGMLVEVQGTLVRAEEFSYSYELDLIDDEGQLLGVYVDKGTNATIDALTEGEVYRAIGIMEIRDGYNLLNPRMEDDLNRVFQPIVYIDADAPSAVSPGGEFTVTLSLENYTEHPLKDLTVWAEKPSAEFTILELKNAGQLKDDQISWTITELPGNGGRVDLQYRLRMNPRVDYYFLESYGAELPSALESSITIPLRVFNGGVVPIWAIQGDSELSPYRLDDVTTTGVVTGVFPDLNGFWIQDLSGDVDPATSEGLFIFTGELQPEIVPEDVVQVTGTVREISAQTQVFVLSMDQIQILSHGTPFPMPVALDPPSGIEAAHQFYESLEGMLVEVDQPATVVGPTSKYGETFTVLSKHGLDRVLRGEETGWMIVIDDGSDITHYDQSTMDISLAVGDQLDYVSGPLAYTFGTYKIEPVVPPQVSLIEHSLPSIDIVEIPDFSIMTWNVENLFDILEPHPNDPPRPRKTDYELSLTKIASTIVSAGAPTLIGVQEVENLKVLQDIADHDLITAYNYSAALIEGTDSRGIDVGYLVRSDQVEVVEIEQFPAPEGLTSRPPLMIHIKPLMGSGIGEIYVLNNHFTSLAGGIEATEPRRNEQALWNVQIMLEIAEKDPEAQFIVLGDLNSFVDSLPIQSLRAASLKHVFDIDRGQTWYSYIYQGTTQTLDHILVSEGLFEILVEAIALHTNADFPLPAPGDPSPRHKSDHDPIIAIFSP
jgi:predicted extracellular nuclease